VTGSSPGSAFPLRLQRGPRLHRGIRLQNLLLIDLLSRLASIPLIVTMAVAI
jgi:hypothetical protein